MIRINSAMKELLTTDESTEMYLCIDKLIEKIVDNTKKIKNCIVYDDKNNIDEKKVDFDKIIKFVGDLTGYEVGCNELRFKLADIPQNQLLTFARKLSKALSLKFNGEKMAVYILLCDGEIELRFHTYRKTDGLWLDSDLDKYDSPILFVT